MPKPQTPNPESQTLNPEAGVQIGDKILSIDRQTVAGLSLAEVGMRMGGLEGLGFRV